MATGVAVYDGQCGYGKVGGEVGVCLGKFRQATDEGGVWEGQFVAAVPFVGPTVVAHGEGKYAGMQMFATDSFADLTFVGYVLITESAK